MFLTLARTLRINQWMKNAVVFVAIIFSGQLFEPDMLARTISVFCIYCALSSGLYIINDILDAPADRRHPIKRHRPIAAGLVSVKGGLTLSFFLIGSSLLMSLYFSTALFFLGLIFMVLHIAYSSLLKSYAVIDIFAISFSFMIRTFAGELVSGFHIPVWLMLTIFFMSLFIASIKRNAELAIMGSEARHTLAKYNKHFLDFLTYTFATATIIAYCLYAYNNTDVLPHVTTSLSALFRSYLPGIEQRRLLTITIPVVVYAVARYGQLFYTRIEGERPEKVVISDLPLMGAMALWGTIVVSLIYLF